MGRGYNTNVAALILVYVLKFRFSSKYSDVLALRSTNIALVCVSSEEAAAVELHEADGEADRGAV